MSNGNKGELKAVAEEIINECRKLSQRADTSKIYLVRETDSRLMREEIKRAYNAKRGLEEA